MKIKAYGIGIVCVMSLLLASCGKKEMDKGEKGSVRAAYFLWVDTVEKSHGVTDGVISLYSGKAILLPTLSPRMYENKSDMKEYFTKFLSLQNLKVTTTKLVTREYGDIAMNTGFYTITYMKDGKEDMLHARFDFWYKKVNGKWKIIFHQSSVLPKEL
jgi:hypothetical protein